MRAGELSVVTLGATTPLAWNSTRRPSWPRVTSSRCNADVVAVPLPGMSAAAAISTNASSATIAPNSCFRISLSPHVRPFRLHVFRRTVCSLPGLHGRSRNLLHYFARDLFPQPVLQRFLEHHRIARDLDDVTVEHRVVLAQEIRLVQAVCHDRDQTVLGTNHSAQVDCADF